MFLKQEKPEMDDLKEKKNFLTFLTNIVWLYCTYICSMQSSQQYQSVNFKRKLWRFLINIYFWERIFKTRYNEQEFHQEYYCFLVELFYFLFIKKTKYSWWYPCFVVLLFCKSVLRCKYLVLKKLGYPFNS